MVSIQFWYKLLLGLLVQLILIIFFINYKHINIYPNDNAYAQENMRMRVRVYKKCLYSKNERISKQQCFRILNQSSYGLVRSNLHNIKIRPCEFLQCKRKIQESCVNCIKYWIMLYLTTVIKGRYCIFKIELKANSEMATVPRTEPHFGQRCSASLHEGHMKGIHARGLSRGAALN